MQKVSLITTVLNDEAGTQALLDALLEQTVQPDEIVVVDGGSKDNTVALLESYVNRFKRLTILHLAGANISEGRNFAIQHAQNSLIAVTDAGCRPDSNWLGEITKPLFADPDLDAVSGLVIPESTSLLEYYCGLLALPDHASKNQDGMFYGRNSAFRRPVWEKIGGYPVWLYTGEDSLFAKAAKEHGFSALHTPAAKVYWRPRSSWKKIAKMFFLYGKGNGRILWGDIKGCLYWLKYHGMFWLSLLIGCFYPVFWLASVFAAARFYRSVFAPALAKVGKIDKRATRFFYVPLITYVRSISTNLGYLSGYLEFKKDPSFKNQLDNYMAN